MLKREVFYTHDGDTFVGQYRVTEHDHVQSVSVQFDGVAIAARIGGLKEDVVARTLLGELVREKCAEEEKARRLGLSLRRTVGSEPGDHERQIAAAAL